MRDEIVVLGGVFPLYYYCNRRVVSSLDLEFEA